MNLVKQSMWIWVSGHAELRKGKFLLTWIGFGLQDCKRGYTWHLYKNYAISWTSAKKPLPLYLITKGLTCPQSGFWEVPQTYTADFIVSECCVGRIHHHHKLDFGIGHVAIAAWLVKGHRLLETGGWSSTAVSLSHLSEVPEIRLRLDLPLSYTSAGLADPVLKNLITRQTRKKDMEDPHSGLWSRSSLGLLQPRSDNLSLPILYVETARVSPS